MWTTTWSPTQGETGRWCVEFETGKPGRWSRKAGGRYSQCSSCLKHSVQEKWSLTAGGRYSLWSLKPDFTVSHYQSIVLSIYHTINLSHYQSIILLINYHNTREMQGIVGQASDGQPSKCIFWEVVSVIDWTGVRDTSLRKIEKQRRSTSNVKLRYFAWTQQPTHELDCRTSSGGTCLCGTNIGGPVRTRWLSCWTRLVLANEKEEECRREELTLKGSNNSSVVRT